MAEQVVVPTSVRGYVLELQAQIQTLSERAANLAANLATAREQNETAAARIDALTEELTTLRGAAKMPEESKAERAGNA